MRTSKMPGLPEGSLAMELPSERSDRSYESSEHKHEDLMLTESDVRPKKRGRPRIHPYCYDKLSAFPTAQYKENALKQVYGYHHGSSYGYGPEDYAALKEGYSLNPSHLDPSYKLTEYKDKEYYDRDAGSVKEDLVDADEKDKHETDTRLTSSSDVLSNFNYETIDNYEASDNNETIDNYTTSEEYITSLNDNCEFPIKSNDSCFNIDETAFTSTTFNASDDFIQTAKDQMLQKEPDLVPSKEQQILDEQLESLKDLDTLKELESDLGTTRDLELESETSRYVESELEPAKELEREESTKEFEKEKKHLDTENMYVISEELRQSYIRQSKLLPKIRGVWFNSTVRRMGWVGQAYKKCKRIEKIFSINKHGFEGARKLAIAFRNSQKPTNKSEVLNYPDVSLKDVIKPISQLRINVPTLGSFNSTFSSSFPSTSLNSSLDSTKASSLHSTLPGSLSSDLNKDLAKYLNPDAKEAKSYSREAKYSHRERTKERERDRHQPDESSQKSTQDDENAVDDNVYPVDYRDIIDSYKSELNREDASARDTTCRDALLFMLYELAALLELDFPVPPMSKVDCKRGLTYHINFLENSKRSVDLLPYINSLAHYICRGVTPTDMAHFELYSLIKTLSHCKPLRMEFTTH